MMRLACKLTELKEPAVDIWWPLTLLSDHLGFSTDACHYTKCLFGNVRRSAYEIEVRVNSGEQKGFAFANLME